MRRTIGYAAMLTAIALLVAGAGAAGTGELPPHITKEDLARTTSSSCPWRRSH